MADSNVRTTKYVETKRLIRQAIFEKQLVLFIGSGTSIDSGMPCWSEAVCKIADKMGIQNENLDYLKIPQYYYNARGNKEYTQLMREIFRFYDRLDTQAVHKKIMEFNVDTIITTNYDHLLEQSAEEAHQILHVISQDKDLPYRKAGKELIKMHGDFEHDNFVLKEDDYLHYHHNFKLIENYVKSIIGSKMVLFIGYSLNDPDIKQIFTWVKEILSENFQRAYLIEAGKSYNENENEYFKHLGVNLIYSKELFEQDRGISKNLLKTLDYLLSDDNEERQLLDIVYENLKPFEGLQYIYMKYIKKAFFDFRIHRPVYSISSDGILTCKSHIGDDETENKSAALLHELIKADSEEQVDKRIKTIYYVLSHSSIKGIEYTDQNNETHVLHFSSKNLSEWEDAIFHFDYNKLLKLKESNMRWLTDNSPVLYLQQASICCFLNDYLTAYSCLSNAASIFYKRKEHILYFIATLGKYNVGRIINWNSYQSIDDDMQRSIIKEVGSIDIEKTLLSIPNLGNNNEFLKDLSGLSLSSELFYNAFQHHLKSVEESRTRYSFYIGLPAYENLRLEIQDYYFYCLKNHILIDHYRENSYIYGLFARSLFSSLSMPDKTQKNDLLPFGASSNIRVEKLTTLDIHLILRYVEFSKLKRYYDDFNLDIIELEDEAFEYLTGLIDTLPGFLANSHWDSRDLFNRYISFLSHVKLYSEIVIKCFKIFTSIETSLYWHLDESLTMLTKAVYSQKIYEDENVCASASSLISRYLYIVLQNSDMLTPLRNPITLLINCCYQGKHPYTGDSVFKELLDSGHTEYVIDLYSALSNESQTFIKNCLTPLNTIDCLHDCLLYAKTVLNDIQAPCQKLESEAFVVILNAIHQAENGILDSTLEKVLYLYVNLYLAKLLINKNGFVDIVNRSDSQSIKWLILMDSFDYSQFDLNWLTVCRDTLLIKIAKNEVASKEIKKLFLKKYNEAPIDKKIIDIMINYFYNTYQ